MTLSTQLAMICRQTSIFVLRYGHTKRTIAYPDLHAAVFNSNRAGTFAQPSAQAAKLYMERYHSEYLPDGA